MQNNHNCDKNLKLLFINYELYNKKWRKYNIDWKFVFWLFVIKLQKVVEFIYHYE